MKSKKSQDVSSEPIVWNSSSNWEYELSDRSKSSSSSSFSAAGDVGGVVKGFDCVDDRAGVDEAFSGLEQTGSFPMLIDPGERCR